MDKPTKNTGSWAGGIAVATLLPLVSAAELLFWPTTIRSNTETASHRMMSPATNAACFTQHNDEHRSDSTRINPGQLTIACVALGAER